MPYLQTLKLKRLSNGFLKLEAEEIAELKGIDVDGKVCNRDSGT